MHVQSDDHHEGCICSTSQLSDAVCNAKKMCRPAASTRPVCFIAFVEYEAIGRPLEGGYLEGGYLYSHLKSLPDVSILTGAKQQHIW